MIEGSGFGKDPDPDPWGPKTWGSGASGSGSGTLVQRISIRIFRIQICIISSCVSCRDGARSVRAAATGRAGRSSSSSTSSLTRANRSRQGSRGTTPLAQSRHVETHSVCILLFTILHKRYRTVPKLVILMFTVFMDPGQYEKVRVVELRRTYLSVLKEFWGTNFWIRYRTVSPNKYRYRTGLAQDPSGVGARYRGTFLRIIPTFFLRILGFL